MTDFIIPALEDILLESIDPSTIEDLELRELITSGKGAAGTERLHAYWRSHITWGHAGDFDSCVSHLSKYIRDPEGYCAKMHKVATGGWPGHAPGEHKESHVSDTTLEEAGKVYHWKHGWIPLDHAAAPEAKKGDVIGVGRLQSGHTFTHDGKTYTANSVTHGEAGSYTHSSVQAIDSQGDYHNLALPTRDSVTVHASRYDEHGNVLPENERQGHYAPTPERNGNARQQQRVEKLLSDAEASIVEIKGLMKTDPGGRANYQMALDNHKRTVKWARAEIRKMTRAKSKESEVTDDYGDLAIHESVTLSERATNSGGGIWRVTAISAGLGSSGYYSPDVLQEAANNGLIKEGTPLFFDHASDSERTDRPERSVKDIAAVFTGPGQYDAREKALVGDVKVFGPYRELVKEMAPYIGLSISGSATDITEGEYEGRRVPVVEGLRAVDSVDLVTRAGRGGKFTSLLESARAQMDHKLHQFLDDPTDVPATRPGETTTESQETHMGQKQIEESEFTRLTEAAGRVDKLEAELATTKAALEAAKPEPAGPIVTGPRAVVAKHISEQDSRIAALEARESARQVVEEALSEAWLGDSQKARVRTALMAVIPMKENQLDEQALRTAASERINEAETEAAEILSSAGVGTPRGLGGLPTNEQPVGEKFEAELVESFIRRGMSKDAAEIAVKGH